MNTFYIVFFGVLLSFFISVKQDQIMNGISPWLLIKSNLLFFLLLAYYVFDWLTSNELYRLRGDTTVVLLLIGIVITMFLGATIVYSVSEGLFKFFLIGVYAVLVPFWDISLYRENIEPKISIRNGVAYLIFFVGIRFIVALYLMMLILSHKFFNCPTFYQQAIILLIAYLSIKIMRYLYLIEIIKQIESTNSSHL